MRSLFSEKRLSCVKMNTFYCKIHIKIDRCGFDAKSLKDTLIRCQMSIWFSMSTQQRNPRTLVYCAISHISNRRHQCWHTLVAKKYFYLISKRRHFSWFHEGYFLIHSGSSEKTKSDEVFLLNKNNYCNIEPDFAK